MNTSIDVAIRVRPLIDSEKRQGLRNSRLKLDTERNEIKLYADDRQNSKVFMFDKVCDESVNQQAFYDSVKIEDYINRVLEGYHATIFCYGQTSAGKTYTMEGIDYETVNQNRNNTFPKQNKLKGFVDEGIIPRGISSIFRKTEALSKKYNRTYNISCSFLEIYNERVYDLLNPDQISRMTSNSPGLKLRWNKRDQFVVENLYVFTCVNAEEANFLFQVGIKNKTMASHKLNNASSRSHTIFEIRIDYYDNNAPDDIISSKLELVDLAGSERVSIVSPDGKVTKETIDINKSLFTLRQVINCIADNQNRQKDFHVPYRDSKLTALLKQSIGGNSYCLMIACLAPHDDSFDENLSTLSYATKVTKIQNEPIKNDDPKWKIINTLKGENKELLEKLNDANERILNLTETMKRKGHLGVSQSNRFSKGSLAEGGGGSGSPQNQQKKKEMNEDDVITNAEAQIMRLKQSQSEQTGEGKSEDSYLTEELVEAINQIRYLLGSLKQEREKNEYLGIQLEKQDNLVSQLMRENQELRDQISYAEESGHIPNIQQFNTSYRKQRSKSPVSVLAQTANRLNVSDKKMRGAKNPQLEGQLRKLERENLMYTTMSTLNPDHEPMKGLVTPNGTEIPHQSANNSRVHSSGTNQTGFNENNVNGSQNGAESGETHFRTTTHFARNTMYRKLANSNNFQGGGLTSESDLDRNNLSSDGGLSMPGSRKSAQSNIHSRARNRSDMMSSNGLDDGYNVSNLLPIKGASHGRRDGDKGGYNHVIHSSMERQKKIPSASSHTNSRTSTGSHLKNSKLLLLKDITHNINPVIQYPKKGSGQRSSKGSGVNQSFY